MPQSKTGGLDTAVISTTTRVSQILYSYRTIPDQKRTTKVCPYLRQRWWRQCIVLRQENLREWKTSISS
ncbi:hypothetical protein DPMN_169707 [Dreissena polymorpha]|uniref:Uncharacterized protein n=1 Tax=Dreissena polymorpha TaxID=45954 RepID=A0A9D4DY82_DREPO|nr:hypothetical protein DPMN_169707 [Dreissena polymorpha]